MEERKVIVRIINPNKTKGLFSFFIPPRKQYLAAIIVKGNTNRPEDWKRLIPEGYGIKEILPICEFSRY